MYGITRSNILYDNLFKKHVIIYATCNINTFHRPSENLKDLALLVIIFER